MALKILKFLTANKFYSTGNYGVISLLIVQLCLTLCNPMDCSLLLCPWDFSGENTGVGCHSILQGNFPTQGLNLVLPHCRQCIYHLNHLGSPILKEKDTIKSVNNNTLKKILISILTGSLDL